MGMKGVAHTGLGGSVAATLLAVFAASPTGGAIDLELRPVTQTVTVGSDVQLVLYTVSDDQNDQLLAALQAIIAWQPQHLQLVGINSDGAVMLLSSEFPEGDPFGLNETVPPQDGDGIYVAFAPLSNPVAATPEGAIITTFEFLAVTPTPGTPVGFLTTAGDPPTDTIVFDGEVANLDVTGMLSGAVVTVLPCCPPDLDGDCIVGIVDFLALLAAWGTDPGGPPDLDGDGDVGIVDFLMLLAAWGPCP